MASVLAAEIASQPETIARFLDRQVEPTRRVVETLPRFSYVLLAARGSSDHAGIYAQYVWGLLGRLPVALAAPSLHTVHRRTLPRPCPTLRRGSAVWKGRDGAVRGSSICRVRQYTERWGSDACP